MAPRTSETGASSAIAIIGMAGRFPRAWDIHQFWENLRAGVECSTRVTADDLRAAGIDPAVLHEPDYVSEVFALEDPEHFDAEFFGFSPRDAEYLEPQHRLLLETAAAALDHAGYDPDRYEGLIGVFAGVGRNSYYLHALSMRPQLFETAGEYHALIGNERDFPTTHISFRLNLRGPSIDVQTACSTSGVAVHLACQSLRAGDCDIALAGGAKVIIPNRVGYRYVEGGPLAPEGHIRAFDANASGMVRGSGAALLVLKRLDDAIADGDRIHAVVIGSAVNNDGGGKIGFTAPSVAGQAAVIAEAQAAAGVSADQISYIEAHGTGTLLGDPIEIAGLTEAFRRSTERSGYCRIGSVKTNIGHLDAGATAAGIIKTVLSLRHEELPPSLNCATPNPQIDWQRSPFVVNTALSPWKRGPAPRRAGVSSFGLGGTNAHIVLEEPPATRSAPSRRRDHVLVLSARNGTALEAATRNLARHLELHADQPLADVAYTLQVGRREWSHRRAIVCTDHASGAEALMKALGAGSAAVPPVGAAPSVAFLFPGAGGQYAGMASDLYASEAQFRVVVDACVAAVEPALRDSVHGYLVSGRAAGQARFAVEFSALVITEYALALLWRHWGVASSALYGFGAGEYVAAALSGVLAVDGMLRLAAARGRVFDALSGDLIPHPEPGLSALTDDATTLHLALARHDEGVRVALEAFRREAQGMRFSPGNSPLLSGVSGLWTADEQICSAPYWVSQLRQQARIGDALTTLLQPGGRALLELGPGAALTAFARRHPLRRFQAVASAMGSADDAPERTLMHAVSELWCAGVSLDWLAIHGEDQRQRVELPTYPFTRQRYSLVPPIAATPAAEPLLVPASHASATPTSPVTIPETTRMTVAPAIDGQTRVERVMIELKRILHELSGIDAGLIDGTATFLELGFDSLFLAEANSAFKKRFGVRITTRQLMEKTPTLAGLAAFLDEQLPPDAFPPLATPPAASQTPATAVPAAPPVDGAGAPSQPSSRSPLEALIAEQMRLMQAQLATLQAFAGQGATLSPPAPTTLLPAAAPAAAAPPSSAVPDRTSPWQPVAKSAGEGELTDRQRAHLDDLVRLVQARTGRSKALTQASRASLADPRTVQGFRKQWKEIVYPLVSDRAEGSRIWDVDGNEYIDLVNGYGVTFFGHSPKFITDAATAQLAKTVAIGPQTPLAGEVAQLVCELTGHERAAFCNTGSEAVLAAIRMARTVTGRTKLATFAGHYHGIFDEVLGKGVGTGAERRAVPQAPGIPAHAVSEVIVLDYDNPASLDVIRRRAGEIALVMVEPVRSRNLDRQPREFLQALRRVTEELGIPLLFDEMITGFRSHPGGAQAVFGVRADIATYGKVIGGGFPIGVVAGKARYLDALDGGMWQYGDDSSPEADMTWFAGTFVRHPLALAAAKAALTYLKDAGPELQLELNRRTRRFTEELNAHFRSTNTPIHIEQFASSFFVSFTSYQDHSPLLFFHLRNRGIYTYEGRPAFFTLAHSDEDMAAVATAFKESVAELQAVGFLPGGEARAPETRIVPLAEGQQEIWLATRFGDDASRAFNLASTLALRGALRPEALSAAVQRLVDRHEALRAIPGEDGVTQRILPTLTIPVPLADLSTLSAEARERELEIILTTEVETVFDLTTGPLVRARLVRVGADEHHFILTVHHIVCDGWSCGVLLRDLGRLYESECQGTSVEMPAVMQLSEFATASLENRESAERAEAEEYWLNEFKPPIPVLELPTDRPRPPRKTFRAKRITLPLDQTFAVRIKRLAADQGSTLFSTLLAGFTTLMHRLSGQDDLVVGFSLAGQSNITDRDLVGHCVTFLPLRFRIDANRAFGEFVQDVRGKVLDAVEHQNLAFGGLLRRLRIARDPSRVPLMSVAFNLDPSGRKPRFHDLRVESGSVGRRYENFDMFFNVVELGGDRYEIQCTFNLDLFDEQTMWHRLSQYTRLLDAAAAAPATSIGALGLATGPATEPYVPGREASTAHGGGAPGGNGDGGHDVGIRRIVMSAWQDVLGLQHIAPDADFFEIGGHSLLGARVITHLREQLGVELSLASLFEAPTISQLTRRIEALQYIRAAAPVATEKEVIEL